jgi:hypothetical protein
MGFPETPDVRSRVAARIVRPAPTARRPRRIAALAAAAVIVFAGVLLVVSPGARRAVADWLGIGGVRVTYGDPPSPGRSAGAGLDLGEPVTLAEAADRADFELRALAPDRLGPPHQVYAAEAPGFVQIAFVYDATEDLPAAPGHEEGIVFVQFRGEPDEAYFKKTASFGSGVDPVVVSGAPGFWIRGDHDLRYIGGDGTPFEERSRLSASTLVWEDEGVTYRLESGLSKAAALELARDLG